MVLKKQEDPMAEMRLSSGLLAPGTRVGECFGK
jgi:hypothetical protein